MTNFCGLALTNRCGLVVAPEPRSPIPGDCMFEALASTEAERVGGNADLAGGRDVPRTSAALRAVTSEQMRLLQLPDGSLLPPYLADALAVGGTAGGAFALTAYAESRHAEIKGEGKRFVLRVFK